MDNIKGSHFYDCLFNNFYYLSASDTASPALSTAPPTPSATSVAPSPISSPTLLTLLSALFVLVAVAEVAAEELVAADEEVVPFCETSFSLFPEQAVRTAQQEITARIEANNLFITKILSFCVLNNGKTVFKACADSIISPLRNIILKNV